MDPFRPVLNAFLVCDTRQANGNQQLRLKHSMLQPEKLSWKSNVGFFLEGVMTVYQKTLTGWWFQPISKILVKMEFFPK